MTGHRVNRGSDEELFLRRAHAIQGDLVAWRRKLDFFKLLQTVSLARHQEVDEVIRLSASSHEWEYRWARAIADIVRWVNAFANRQSKRAAREMEYMQVVDASLNWQQVEGSVAAVKRGAMTVVRRGDRFILHMTDNPDYEVLDLLIEKTTNPTSPGPALSWATLDWFRHRRGEAVPSGQEGRILWALYEHALKLVRWRREALPEGPTPDDLILAQGLTMESAVRLYAVLVALRNFADFYAQLAGKSEATMLSFWPDECVDRILAYSALEDQQAVESFVELMTFKEENSANPIGAPLVPVGGRLVLPPGLVATAGVDRILLRSAATDPRRFGRLGQQLGKLSDRFAALLKRIPSVEIHTRVKAYRSDGSTAGDIDVLALDPAAGEALALEVKWPVEARTLQEELRITRDIERGAAQLANLHGLIIDGAVTLRLPAQRPDPRSLNWSLFVATPGQITATGTNEVAPTSLRHIAKMLPANTLTELKSRLCWRPERGVHYDVVETRLQVGHLNIIADALSISLESWPP